MTHHGIKVRLLIRTRGSLKLGSLDLGARHLLAQKDLSTKKEFVVVARGIGSAREARKAIEIQLTLKGSQLGLTKVSV